jgi:hypothetical protein
MKAEILLGEVSFPNPKLFSLSILPPTFQKPQKGFLLIARGPFLLAYRGFSAFNRS